MKRLTAILILFALCFASGCHSGKSPEIPVKYYYPNATISYGTEDGFLSYEQREGIGRSADASIAEYLKGPVDSVYSNPFPKNTKLISFEMQDDIIHLVLSDNYATLTGLHLSVANACLSMTVLELTGANTVSIQCESVQIDGQNSIMITRDSILLYDSNKTTTPSEPAPSATER